MDFHFQPIPHDEAINLIKAMPTVERAVYDELIPELKAAVFTVKGVALARDREAIRDILAAVPGGEKWDDAKRKVIAVLKANDFNDKAAARRAELLLRHYTGVSYMAAKYRIMDRQRMLFPWWQYLSMGDTRVRATHAALNGKIFAHDSPFWATHFPPWEPLCRCIAVPLSDFDVEEIREADKAQPPEKRRVVEGPLLENLLKNDQLVLGMTEIYDLRTPAQKGQSWTGWNPKNLVPARADLEKQLQPESMKELMEWAVTVKVDGGATVAEWIEGIPQSKREKAVGPYKEPKPRKPRSRAVPNLAEPRTIPDITELKAGKRLGGSTGAFEHTDASGNKYVVKRGASADHIREEHAADEIYRAAGVAVPPARLQETPAGPAKVALKIEGLPLGEWIKTASPKAAADMTRQLRDGFAVDALGGNWDVIGISQDNIIVDRAGKPWRIDNGGSLRQRAMGGLKTATEWQAHPDELWTMRESAQGQSVFSGLSIQEIAAQITKLDEAKILAATPAAVQPIVKARLQTLRDVAAKAQDMASTWNDAYTDALTREIVGLRRAGITARLPKELKQSPGQTHGIVDENGKPWDELRSGGMATVTGSGDYPAILNAVKTINAHLGKGDTNFNAGTMATAVKLLPAYQKKAKSGDAEAQHYLPFLTQIEAASKGTPAKIPQISQWTPAGKKARPAQSIVTDLAAHMKARGGDYSIVGSWQSSQAGSSWSNYSLAYKSWIADRLSAARGKDKIYWKASTKAAETTLMSLRQTHGKDTWDKSFLIHHAFIQEMLASVEFRHNDRAARKTRLFRTEASTVVKGLAPGASATLKRGLNESASIFEPAYLGSELTVQAVPHHRITGSYFLERGPGSGQAAFMGDGENEFTFVPVGLPCKYTGGRGSATNDAGNDSTKWEIQ